MSVTHSPNATDLDEMLRDVRSAYRLLHDYQRLVLDSIKYIGDSLEMGLQTGFPIFSDPPARMKSWKLDQWSWDWLSLYHHVFQFQRDSIRLSVQIISDTGFHESESEDCNDVLSFRPVDKSNTLVALIASSNGETCLMNKARFDYQAIFKKERRLPENFLQEGLYGKFYPFQHLTS